ncbi:MAG: hypothetical protein ACLFS2_02430 [Halochromatium sp.]|uniref:hypothetical protein n=1 Tax=Halochromatium sp. TaxID=2049430 RepID=UPI00397DDE1D
MDAVATSVHELAQQGESLNGASQNANVTQFDVANFQDAMARFDSGQIGAGQVETGNTQTTPADNTQAAPWGGMKQVGEAALNLSDRAGQVRGEAFEALSNKDELSPSDMLSLTVEVHKFSFHSQMSSNVANRSSQGVQELFRQQL